MLHPRQIRVNKMRPGTLQGCDTIANEGRALVTRNSPDDRCSSAVTADSETTRARVVTTESSDPTGRPRRPTIRDVARAAGVSVGTASKALNGKGRLRPETRARVIREAELLEFRPNDLIKSLIRGRSYTVGLVTTDYFGRFNMPVIAGIEDALGAAEILVFLCTVRDDPVRERNVVASLIAKQVDGIIVMGRRTDPRPPISVGQSGIPVVYAFSRVTGGDAFCLAPDEDQGACLAIDHLIRLGRRHLAHITGPSERESVELRLEGMRRTVLDHGLDWSDERCLSGEWSEEWGYEAVNQLLDVDPAVDGIVCGSDIIARGVLDGLRERGRCVPDDVSVVGFDNWEIVAEHSRPPLTTIDMNLHDMGHEAARRLLARLEGDRTSGTIRLPCSLIVRQSCGATSIS
jgi:LacI family transcriptional regulator